MRGIKTTVISVLALGLLAGSAVGVAAQDEAADDMPAGPVTFSGTFEGTWPPVDEGTFTFADGLELVRDEVLAGSIVTTDSRLTGAVLQAQNTDIHSASGRDQFVAPRSVSWRIENEDGAWTGQGHELHGWGSDDPHQEPHGATVLMLTGEGGYQGLSAYLMVDWSTWSEDTLPTVDGALFPGEAPPFPEMPAAVE
jgi:hypothetical protein